MHLFHKRSKQAQKWRETLYVIVKLKGKKIRCLATVICIKVGNIQQGANRHLHKEQRQNADTPLIF